jgi:hypothetical protein
MVQVVPVQPAGDERCDLTVFFSTIRMRPLPRAEPGFCDDRRERTPAGRPPDASCKRILSGG